jgi:hypothetical protein
MIPPGAWDTPALHRQAARKIREVSDLRTAEHRVQPKSHVLLRCRQGDTMA